jgi:hypothetical protein
MGTGPKPIFEERKDLQSAPHDWLSPGNHPARGLLVAEAIDLWNQGTVADRKLLSTEFGINGVTSDGKSAVVSYHNGYRNAFFLDCTGDIYDPSPIT